MESRRVPRGVSDGEGFLSLQSGRVNRQFFNGTARMVHGLTGTGTPMYMNSYSFSWTSGIGERREEKAGGGPHPRAPAGEKPADDAATVGRRRRDHQRARSGQSDRGRGGPAGRHGPRGAL